MLTDTVQQWFSPQEGDDPHDLLADTGEKERKTETDAEKRPKLGMGLGVTCGQGSNGMDGIAGTGEQHSLVVNTLG